MQRVHDPGRIQRRLRHLDRRITSLLALRLRAGESTDLDARIAELQRRHRRLAQAADVGGCHADDLTV